MHMNEEGEFEPVPQGPTHYHGDAVRALFLTAAALVFATRFIGTELPFTFGAQMLLILTLVITAGITNPAQKAIHYVNMLVSVAGTLTFGSLAFSRIETSEALFSGEGLIVLIAFLFLAALYFSTRTVRGLSVPHVRIGSRL